MIKYSQVKDIDSHDFTQVIDIYRNAFPKNERLPISKLQEKVKDNQFELWVTYEKSKVIFLAILCSLIESNFILLGYIATAENYRGRGIAKDFLLWWKNHNHNQYLLLEVENPAVGEGEEIKQKRVKFYQKLGANTVNNLRYFLPDLTDEKAPEMILMIYPNYEHNFIKGELIKQLIISTYERFYDQYNHPNISLLWENIPENLELV